MTPEKADALQKICLGCLVSYPEILKDSFFKDFSSRCFISPMWQNVYEKIVELHRKTEEINYITVSSETDIDVVTIAGLDVFMNSVAPDTSEWRTYFNSLIRLRKRYDVIEILEKHRSMLSQQYDITDIVPSLTQDVLALEFHERSAFNHRPTDLTSLSACSSPVFFGLSEVDDELEYLGNGKLIIIGGRPGWGKSILAQQAIVAHSEAGMNCCLFSFEMSQSEVDRRLYSISSGVPLNEIKKGRFSADGTLDRIYQNFWIFGKGEDDIDSASVCRQVEQLHEEVGLKSVFFDYLQMAVVGGISRKQSLSAYSRALKKMATATGINVFLLAQLNRGCMVDRRNPNLHSDVAECDNIMQDADLGIAIYPNSDSLDVDGSRRKVGDKFLPTSVFDCQKYRDGKVFSKKLANDFECVRFKEIVND